MPTPDPNFPHFFQALQSSNLFTPWNGTAFRSAVPKWMSEPYRFTGLGSALAGGRWNVQKLMTAIYFSLDVQTLNAEAYAKAARFGWNPQHLQPQLQISATVNLQAILDLTAASTLTSLGLNSTSLTQCQWLAAQSAGSEAITQAVARAAFENMAEGVLVPSAQLPGGFNLVVFPSNLRTSNALIVMHPSQIPFAHGLP